MTSRESDEITALEALARLFGEPADGETWIGDDAAVLVPPVGRLLFATDAVVANVHFDAETPLADVGWTLVARNVSDIAAMGGEPWRLVISVTGATRRELDRLYEGVRAATREYGCAVVGGDLSGGPTMVASAAILGVCEARPVLRSGAGAGEALYVTGPLGASAAGLRALREDIAAVGPNVEAHRRPRARVAEGRVAAEIGATAMIDVSDGLALDLHRLADASGVGFALDSVPVATGATEQDALGGGEDYALIFSLDDTVDARRAFGDAGLEGPLRIGTVREDASERTYAGAALLALGWRHSLGAGER